MTSAAATNAANKDSARGATRTPSVEQFNGSQQIGTLMPHAATTTLTRSTTQLPALTIEQVIGAPLNELLTHQNAQIVDITSIDDDRFFGQAVEKRSGELILAMPAGRAAAEREVTIRLLIAHIHGLPCDRWPSFMQATDVTGDWTEAL